MKNKYTNYRLGKKSKHFSRKRIGLLAIFILLALITGFTLLYLNQRSNKQDKSDDESGLVDETAGIDISEPSDKFDPTIPADDIPVTESFSININSVLQNEGKVEVSASISGASDGDCVFTFTSPESRPVVKQVVVDSGMCKVSILEIEFDKIGVWDLEATIFRSGQKTNDSRKVTIQ